jgi:hypothetical protein
MQAAGRQAAIAGAGLKNDVPPVIGDDPSENLFIV